LTRRRFRRRLRRNSPTLTLDIVEAVYWRAHAIALLVDNQETWQRVKGGDHVRRLEIVGADDEHTCDMLPPASGQAVSGGARAGTAAPRLHLDLYGCRCRYEPVLETLDEIPLIAN
jgi:hypothetical protein